MWCVQLLFLCWSFFTVSSLVAPPWAAGGRRSKGPPLSKFVNKHRGYSTPGFDSSSFVPPGLNPSFLPPGLAKKLTSIRPNRPNQNNRFPNNEFSEKPFPVDQNAKPFPADYNAKPNLNKPHAFNNYQEICGITHNSRIVGGGVADRQTWTWIAALVKKSEPKVFCGGSLITQKHVLTAAHCLNNLAPRDMFVRLGAYDFSDDIDASAEDHTVVRFRIHPEYDRHTHVNDIAILTLQKEATFSDFVRPICLPPKRRTFFGQLATVIGWGFTTTGEHSDGKLRQVTVPIWNNTDCNEAYKRKFNQTSLCAGYHEGGKDSCQGDSGGPLMLQSSRKRWMIVGIVSWGLNCGEAGYPGVYARVNNYIDWIERNIRNDS